MPILGLWTLIVTGPNSGGRVSTSEGKSKRETMRCLKRYIARELYGVLVSAVVPTTSFSTP